MKIAFKTLLTLLPAITTLSSCDSCGDATITHTTRQDRAWLVYQRGDSIQFVDEQNTISTYARSTTDSVHVPAEGYSVSEKCIDKLDTEVGNIIQDRRNQKPGLGIYILKRPDNLNLKVAVESQGTWEVNENNPTYASLSVNGVNYNEVFEVTPDSTKANGVKRILFNKEKGFLSIQYFGGKKMDLVRLVRQQ